MNIVMVSWHFIGQESQNETKKRVCLVQHLAFLYGFVVPGGSLYDSIVKKEAQGELFSEEELKDLLLQVSLGLKYIHSSGLAHLDIKPSN